MVRFKSLDMVLAGGIGGRLFPLTRDRTKPAVPFGHKYRIIDIPVNNLVNSGSRNIVIAAGYMPNSLMRHINHAWKPIFEREGHEFIKICKPEHGHYNGTADAVYQNLGIIQESKPNIIGVFCGDHIYIMDVSQMKQFHLDNEADITIAALPVSSEVAKRFGVLVINKHRDVTDFYEKVDNPPQIPGMEGYCWASMGNYIFNRPILVKALEKDAKKTTTEYKELILENRNLYSSNDFGFDIITALLAEGKKIKMYDFRQNRPDEVLTTGYWRDVGTLDQFIESNMDLLGPNPKFVIDNPGWSIVTYDESHGKEVHGAEFAKDSLLANGVSIEKSSLERCIVSYNTIINEGCEISDTIIFGHCIIGKKVRLKKTVVDRGVNIPDGMRIGVFHDEDKAHRLAISPEIGYAIIPRNYEF